MAILFITATRIGDAVQTTGLLAWLLEHDPEQSVSIVCGRPAAPLFEALPRLERQHVLEKRPWNRHWFDLWRDLERRRWDILVDLRNSTIPWLVRARKRFVLGRIDPSLHRVELMGRVLGLPPQAPVLWTGPAHEERAAALLGPDPNVLALAPAAAWMPKKWPTERFVELAERLTAPRGALPGARILLMGSDAERVEIMPFFEGLPKTRLIDGFGLDVLSTFAALRRCRLMVGNDSGMMHVSAAAGIPTVGLFGPTRPQWYAPWGPNALVVHAPQPEELPGPLTRTSRAPMSDIEVADVEAAIKGRWPHLV